MLGTEILVAPVLKFGAVTRKVVLSASQWEYVDSMTYDGGGTVEVPAPLEALPYFSKKR